MGKKIAIVIFIVVLLILFGVGGVFAYDNKYLWLPMSEEELRTKAADFYYIEMNQESCELNGFKNFNSKENCQNGIKCISEKLANVLPKEDLRKVLNEMKEGDNAESAVINYFQMHSAIESQYKINSEDCLKWLTAN